MNRIEVISKESDARDKSVEESLSFLKVKTVRVADVYYVKGSAENSEELFCSKLTHEFSKPGLAEGRWLIETRYREAVADPAEESIKKALQDLGNEVDGVRTGKKYYIEADLDQEKVKKACEALSNSLIEECFSGFGKLEVPFPVFAKGCPVKKVSETAMLNADDEMLGRVSRERGFALSLEEMKAVQKYFVKQNRNPSDAEMETLAQTWSEHCKHKTFNSRIKFKNNGREEFFDNLFRETIVSATEKISAKKDWLVSVFKDNAGIISFDDEFDFAFKVETHNHPSALDPYAGASTGIGGVIRDVLGAGLGAKPVFNTDVFCLPPMNAETFSSASLEPRRLFKGVVSGVRDYGNRMGIPTLNGAVVFHERYSGLPLVYCGTGGILPKGMAQKQARPDELIVLAGGLTGRDGIKGATFSSGILESSSSSSAVQIGNPIEEKKLLDCLLQARDRKLYSCITDCGAGGLSSAVGEMGAEIGAEVSLEKVPLKHAGMLPWEIWMSESQERMVFSVPEKNFQEFKEIFESEDVSVSEIGRFSDSGKLKVKFEDQAVADLNMEFLHKGLPRIVREAEWADKDLAEPDIEEKESYDDDLVKILSQPTVASKEEVIRRYDYEVQGNTVGKPLTGADNDGPSDAAVIRPGSGKKNLIIANGINPRYGLISSYWMAASVIDEALRNVVASGGNLDRTALLDNFCWGSTSDKEKLGSFVMASKACRDIAVGFETPFISGKDSLHNEFDSGGRTFSIPDTLLISAVSVSEGKFMSMDLKEEGSSIYILGKTYDELGGSFFYEVNGELGCNVPKVRTDEAKRNMMSLGDSVRQELVLSCHDCSEGGLAVAAAEMAFAGGIGMRIDLSKVPSEAGKDYKTLFSESNSRFLVEVSKDKEDFFESVTGGVKIGETCSEKKLTVFKGGKNLIDSDIGHLKKVWKSVIKW